MRKFKIILMSVVCSVIAALFVTEAFASVMVNLNIRGDIIYVSDEIGADIIGTYTKNGREGFPHTYFTITGPGATDSDGVYQMNGSEDTYTATTASLRPITVYSSSDIITCYAFIKNTGDRNLIPTVSASSPIEDISLVVDKYYFDISEGQTDPISLKRNGQTAPNLISTIEGLVEAVDYQAFADNTSLAKGDVFMAKVVISVSNITDEIQMGNFDLNINIVSDIQYSNTKILSVRQENNIVSSAWEKIGQNANLSASSIKAETNNLSVLDSAFVGTNQNANLSQINSELTYDCDDYDNQPVYKDIDIVNVDVNTGEIVGKLSNTAYDFKWCGETFTLEAGTTLASGRTLTENEEFTVDVYTYYPKMYIRRWFVTSQSVGGGQTTYTYVSLSDVAFAGSVEVPACYVGTCESTIFNADGTLAKNSNGIYCRSFVHGWTPTTLGCAKALADNYGFETESNAQLSTTQAQFLEWQSNLTAAWQTYATNNPSLKSAYEYASNAMGEDYHAFVYQILYIVKYADNDSQAVVGSGNSDTKAIHNGKLKNTDQAYNKAAQKTISISSGADSGRIESEKGSGTIGLRGTAGATTGTTQYNAVGMAYAYNNTTPLYLHSFLTYNNGTKRILRDGYVGSDRYTSVSCLGKFNPWANVGTWVCGMAIILDDSRTVWAYAQFDDYDGSNYYVSNATTTEVNLVDNLGYTKVSYPITNKKGYFRYLGVSTSTSDNSTKNGLLTLIGLPPTTSSAASETTGLTDYYWAYESSSGSPTFGVMIGGTTNNAKMAGVFFLTGDQQLNGTRGDYGFRTMLT